MIRELPAQYQPHASRYVTVCEIRPMGYLVHADGQVDVLVDNPHIAQDEQIDRIPLPLI